MNPIPARGRRPALSAHLAIAAATEYLATATPSGDATAASGTFEAVGSATQTTWVDVDATLAPDPFYDRVIAENAGGGGRRRVRPHRPPDGQNLTM